MTGSFCSGKSEYKDEWINFTVFFSQLLLFHLLMISHKRGLGFFNVINIGMSISSGPQGPLSSNDVRMFATSQLSSGTVLNTFFKWNNSRVKFFVLTVLFLQIAVGERYCRYQDKQNHTSDDRTDDCPIII